MELNKLKVKSFEDPSFNNFMGREIVFLNNLDSNSKINDVLVAIGDKNKEKSIESVIGKTAYIPPAHFKTFNGSSDVLLMPILNILDGIMDSRRAVWHRGVHNNRADFDYYRDDISIIKFLQDNLQYYKNKLRPNPENQDVTIWNSMVHYLIYNGIGALPSWFYSAINAYNPIVHGRVAKRINSLYSTSEVLNKHVTMSTRKIETLYQPTRHLSNMYTLFNNSLDMFLSIDVDGIPWYNSNRSSSRLCIEDLRKFITTTLPIPTINKFRTVFYDHSPLIPLITPVVDINYIIQFLEEFQDIYNSQTNPDFFTLHGPSNIVLNRDKIKFIAYKSIIDNTADPLRNLQYNKAEWRVYKILFDKNVKKLQLSGCDVRIVSKDDYRNNPNNFNYIAGLQSNARYQSGLYTNKDGTFGSGLDFLSPIRTALKDINSKFDSIPNIDLMKFSCSVGEGHIPLMYKNDIIY